MKDGGRMEMVDLRREDGIRLLPNLKSKIRSVRLTICW